MTEQRKNIADKAASPDESVSLYERADGIFGFNSLRPAVPPAKLRPAAGKAEEDVPAPIRPMSRQVASDVRPPERSSSPIALPSDVKNIDPALLHEQGMIVPGGAITALVEEFRIIKRRLLADARASKSLNARRILVTSPHAGDGKTFSACNLAMSIAAERDVEVILIDADFHKPSVARRLGLEATTGLMDVLADPRIAIEDAIIRTNIDGLFVMPAGSQTSSDAEYLASDRTRDVLDRLTEGASNRIIVFDTPPALSASPAAELAKHVSQTVLVARADVTSQSALEDARQLLSSCRDTKLLFNAAHFSPSGRNFGNYDGAGY